jgi:L-serine dehydratase
MRAALRFVRELGRSPEFAKTQRVQVDLYGSLALTGIGHSTDKAILLGLWGYAPDTIATEKIASILEQTRRFGELLLDDVLPTRFREQTDLLFHRDQMYPDAGVVTRPNGMRFTAFDAGGMKLAEEIFYSIGGGFIVSEAERLAAADPGAQSKRVVPYPFCSAEQLLRIADEHGITIAKLVLANECALLADERVKIVRPEAETLRQGLTPSVQSPQMSTLKSGPVPESEATARSLEARVKVSVLELWRAMEASTAQGMAMEGILPGGLKVRRRAPRLARKLREQETAVKQDPLAALDWVTMWAMAVNEENAAGGRVVTAPTNGAAGVIPSIAHYYLRFLCDTASDAEKEAGLLRYFLTAAAIGILYKENASISGAEVGCQGEVGVACSMAAGGLVAAQNGTNGQVEHAAEIAMEHNLGMTCDPIGGLVQIPCIERNGMGAVKAINASRIAMHEAEEHKLSLDQIIKTMYETGMDMQSRYKETSLAGLALNVIEC